MYDCRDARACHSSRDAVVGRSCGMNAVKHTLYISGSTSWHLHQHVRLRSLRTKPARDDVHGAAAVLVESHELRTQPMIEDGNGRLIGIPDRKGSATRVIVNTPCQ